MSHDEYREYENKRFNLRVKEEEEEVDEHGASVVWNSIHDRLFPLCEDILSRKAKTSAGFAVQARAMSVHHAEEWDTIGDEENRSFIEAACAVVGVTPVPLEVRS